MALKAAMVIVLALAVPAREERDDTAKKAMEALQGEWQLAQANFGREAPPPDADQLRFVFQGNKVTIHQAPAGRKEEASFTIDVIKTPFAIDIRPSTGTERDKVVKGIFRVTDKTLELCFREPGGERPTQFNPPDPGEGRNMTVTITFRRVTKK
jgi:uncharacterized protein (TIGR03067 family)